MKRKKMQFKIDKDRCIACGLCVKDCPAGVLAISGNIPTVVPQKVSACIGCQHCLAVCPTAALSILGNSPEQCQDLKGNFPDFKQLEILLKGRRSVRHYQDENLAPEMIEQLLLVAGHAPTGHNAEKVRFHLIDDKNHLAIFRQETYAELARLAQQGDLTGNRAMFGSFVYLWDNKGIDILFRNAPHLLVTTAPKSCPTPVPDCLIALSYLELYAQSVGIGTVWNGFLTAVIESIAPVLRKRLGIPDDHQFGYVMSFGKPAVSYQRTVEKHDIDISRFIP
jgi:nitroreductase/NAD-dependent dihydropyrimidine dehydrogenase PreA subunit